MTDPGLPRTPAPDSPGIVAVDLGNTAAKVMTSGTNQSKPERFLLSNDAWPLQVIGWVNANLATPHGWRIATVNRSACDRLCTAIASHPGESLGKPSPVQTIAHSDIPMQIDVRNPEKVGIDRLLGAFGACRIASPAVIVDAGSAVTIDFVDAQKVYRGGAILPGVTMQARSLASGTDLLPQIDWTDEDALETPGRDTISAIRLGILTNIAAAIDRLVDRYTAGPKIEPALFLTGGDAAAIRPHLTKPSRHHESLVCQAILQL